MKGRFFKAELGQTSIEYMLIIVVMALIGIAFLRKMDEYVVKNPNGLIGKPLKEFQNKLNEDPQGRYRVYPIGPIMK